MSGAVASTPVAAQSAAVVPEPVALGGDDVELSFDDKLADRIEEKRQRAGGKGERGPDGKFLPKAAKAEAAKPAAKPEAKADDKAKEPDGEVAKIKAEAEKAAARASELEARDLEWQTVAEQAYARINALEAMIERIQANGGQLPEADAKNVSLQEELERYKLAEKRAEGERARKAEAEKAAKDAEAVETLRSSLGAMVAKHPELKPAPGAPSLEFWRIVTEAHMSGGPHEAKKVAERIGEVFAKALKAQTAPAAPAAQARTLAKLGGTGGGDTRDLSSEGIREKYMARLRAVS
jgi:hypothetical protein